MCFNCDCKSMTGNSLLHDRDSLQYSASSNSNRSDKNVLSLLVRREVCPKTKHIPRKGWGNSSVVKTVSERDAKHGLHSWVEAESLRHLSAKYCPLVPPPRSTIAAAFSPDGRTLASTHGDHTVKIVDCETGNCLKVLSGHRRTPWVVRFHPLRPEILASGSLDYEVRLWNANTGECIGARDFYRPIASMAFHAEGELLAVASGHKLYIWHYNKRGEASSPTIVLKTRRSLRAVHFHPHGAPFLLTAEVNDLDSPDSSMTRATSRGYLRYPPPAVLVGNVNSNECVGVAAELPLTSLPFLIGSSFSSDETKIDSIRHASNAMLVEPFNSMQPQVDTNEAGNYNTSASPMEAQSTILSSSLVTTGVTETESILVHPEAETHALNSSRVAMETDEVRPAGAYQQDLGFNSFLPLRDHLNWRELPFLRGWLMGQRQAGATNYSSSGSVEDSSQQMVSSFLPSYVSNQNVEAAVASLAMPSSSGLSGRPGLQTHAPSFSLTAPRTGDPTNVQHDASNHHSLFARIQSEIASSLGSPATAELPCTVKLKVWSHDIEHPCTPLNSERCRLVIPHAVLCSEMGAHFSPCGRYLAACVACVVPQMEGDPGLQTLAQQDTGLATSPTRHPVSAHHFMYELRIYSLEEATFGQVLVSRAIRAAHCLTSIQFSPTSEHVLLAYGRRHGSLLKSIVIDRETISPVYTVLEVYSVSDLELVRVLPSSEDEVNVACFHPFAGGGLVYGTKEGKLRVLQYDASFGVDHSATDSLGDVMAKVQTYALEG